MEKECQKCGDMVEGQAVGSNEWFLTYWCDNCEDYIE